MKYVIVTDTHAGCRDDNEPVTIHQHAVWLKVFAFMEVNGICNLLHLGDFFDNRKKISVKTLQFVEWFKAQLETRKLNMTMIIGNHDTAYKNTNDINTPDLLLSSARIKVYLEDSFELDNTLFVNWINKDNHEALVKKIQSSNCDNCFGHFDISGFKYQRNGIASSTGLSQEIFFKFKRVLSGHFHTHQIIGNIEYIGSPMEMTWADYNDPKGFMLWDSIYGEFEFIPTEEHLYIAIELPAEGKPTMHPKLTDLSHKIVRVISHIDEKKTEKFTKALQDKFALAELQVVFIRETSQTINSNVDLTMDLSVISRNYITEVFKDTPDLIPELEQKVTKFLTDAQNAI